MTNNGPSWQFDSKDLYVPIMYDGAVMGYGKPKFAARVVEALNEEEKLKRAIKLICRDLLTYSGGDIRQTDELIKQYLMKAERPKTGPGAIAVLLRDRQAQLDVNDQEFTRFCDSYKLPRAAMNNIYAGEKLPDNLLIPLSRVLGMKVEEIIAIRDGVG